MIAKVIDTYMRHEWGMLTPEIFTYTNGTGYVFAFIRFSVCLSVCRQHYEKPY